MAESQGMTADTYERTLVHNWRSKARYPWSEIARNLGRPVESVRMDYDLTYFPHMKVEPKADPAPPVVPRSRSEARIRAEMDLLKTLYMSGGFVKINTLSTRERDAMGRLKRGYGFDIVSSQPGWGTRLTDKGRKLYERLAQEVGK